MYRLLVYMIYSKSYLKGLLRWRPCLNMNAFSSQINSEKIVLTLSKHLRISESKAQYMCLKYPVIKKLSENKIESVIATVYELGYNNNALIKEPSMFTTLPVTLRFRYKVLQECGMRSISLAHLASYLSIIKQKTIKELKESGEIPECVNIENKLANCMTQWPTSLTTLVYGDVNQFTLYELRLKIIQRYLELVLDLSEEEFQRGIKTYPTIKHRPLIAINETLTILNSLIVMPNYKIKSNLYLIHADPENLKEIIYKFKSIGGVDVKEIIRMHPKIATRSYLSLMETRKILQEFKISNEAQSKCFSVYTLSPSTVRERLEKSKNIPEFKVFWDHPRFLKMIHYKTRAMKRLATLYKNNKKCLSLNILSGSTAHYEVFEKSPGDRMGKSKDLVFCIAQSLGSNYKMNDIRNIIKRHPYWINISLIQLKYVYQQLSTDFVPEDIYENCFILLYPWSKIKGVLNDLEMESKQKSTTLFHEHVDLTKISNSQKLSLTLYLLEKKHYFSGNGVWMEDKKKTLELSEQALMTKKPMCVVQQR